MPTILCFGEILWDCLPQGQFLGGAPFNVAYHLAKLGCNPIVVTAVGRDALGKKTIGLIRSRGIGTKFVKCDPSWPTGTVEVQLDPNGNASYRFTEPAA